MKDQILARDLSATEEVDLMRLQFERTIKNANLALEKYTEEKDEDGQKEAQEILDNARAALEKHVADESTPTITIGYVPPEKFSTLQHRYFAIEHRRDKLRQSLAEIKKEDPRGLSDEYARAQEVQVRLLDDQTGLYREFVRWGVRGHSNLGCDYEDEEIEVGHLKFRVPTWETVQVYESIRPLGIPLLQPLFFEIFAFNMLDPSKKKRSSSQLGISQEISTATSADETPTR